MYMYICVLCVISLRCVFFVLWVSVFCLFDFRAFIFGVYVYLFVVPVLWFGLFFWCLYSVRLTCVFGFFWCVCLSVWSVCLSIWIVCFVCLMRVFVWNLCGWCGVVWCGVVFVCVCVCVCVCPGHNEVVHMTYDPKVCVCVCERESVCVYISGSLDR